MPFGIFKFFLILLVMAQAKNDASWELSTTFSLIPHHPLVIALHKNHVDLKGTIIEKWNVTDEKSQSPRFLKELCQTVRESYSWKNLVSEREILSYDSKQECLIKVEQPDQTILEQRILIRPGVGKSKDKVFRAITFSLTYPKSIDRFASQEIDQLVNQYTRSKR